jgi:energy-coupling factor transporter ATP-binding protein EcfA2
MIKTHKACAGACTADVQIELEFCFGALSLEKLSQNGYHWLQGLQDCANTLVGSSTAGIKGISGGEMKRTSVGIELVTSPKCVFLDEPTSGLDSEIAMTIMRSLRDVASHGRTVALTIHQPNSDITELFDDFLLMAKGRVMYAGELPLQYTVHSSRCVAGPFH